MYELFPEIEGNVFAVKITGEITEKEGQRLSSLVQERAERWGGIRMLVLSDHYPTFNSAEDLYEDLGFIHRNANAIDKMAVLGDGAWKSTWVGLFGLFSGLNAGYFEKKDFEKAWNWLTG